MKYDTNLTKSCRNEREKENYNGHCGHFYSVCINIEMKRKIEVSGVLKQPQQRVDNVYLLYNKLSNNSKKKKCAGFMSFKKNHEFKIATIDFKNFLRKYTAKNSLKLFTKSRAIFLQPVIFQTLNFIEQLIHFFQFSSIFKRSSLKNHFQKVCPYTWRSLNLV